MKPISGKKFAKLLERNGGGVVKNSGKSSYFGRVGSTVRLSVPIHKNQPLKIGLQKHQMKMADIEEKDL